MAREILRYAQNDWYQKKIEKGMSLLTHHGKLSSSGYDFIDEARIHALLACKTDGAEIGAILAKSLAKEPLELEETAALLRAGQPEQVEAILERRKLK